MFTTTDSPVLYRLSEKPQVQDYFIGRLIGAIALLAMMLFLPGGLKVLSMIGFFGLAIPTAKEYLQQQLLDLEITPTNLRLVTGYKHEEYLIDFADIQSVEVIEKYKHQKNRGSSPIRKGETKTILVHDENRHGIFYHPETRCVITTKTGKTIKLKARYFTKGQFAKFLSIMQQAYNAYQVGTPLGYEKAAPLPPTPQATAASKPTLVKKETPVVQAPTPQPLTENEKKINQLIQKNTALLQDDLQLQQAITANMQEVYKSVYRIRDAFDLSKMANAQVIMEFKNPDGSAAYILEDDFHAELDAESIDIAKNLIEAAKKNLSVVQARIAYYTKINKQLETMKFQEAKRQKLQGVAESLKNLQEKNTAKSIDQSLTNMDLDVDSKIIAELEDLSQQVQRVKDLDNAILLNEHISLFKNT
jgi:hypothetical protein